MNRNQKLLGLFLIVIAVIFLFASGSALLVKEVFGIPFGNILVWVGLIGFQLFFYLLNFGFKNGGMAGRIIRALAVASICISIAWFLISYMLSGNVNFNFSSNASSFQGSPNAAIAYWNLIYALIVFPIILTLTYQMIRMFNRRKIKS